MKYLTGKFRSIALIIAAILFSTTASSQNIDTTDIIQSSGFSIETLFRGIIGMAFLIFVYGDLLLLGFVIGIYFHWDCLYEDIFVW